MSYDYCIMYPQTPAFDANIITMLDKIKQDGSSPTIYFHEGNSVTQANPMIGSKPANGKTMLHFRLPDRYTEVELLAYLLEGMVNPTPALSVEYIVSRDKIIEVDNGDPENPNTFIQEVILAPNKAIFLPFMNDVVDSIDGEGNPVMRPPNMGDSLYLSHYYGVSPLELT